MNIIYDTYKIVDHFSGKSGIRALKAAGVIDITFNGACLCDPLEFEDMKRKNFLREQSCYLTEEPQRLDEIAHKLFFKNTKEPELTMPIAVAPYVAPEVKAANIDNSKVRDMDREMLKAAISAGCHSIIVHPLTVGIDPKDIRAINISFYRELEKLAEELNSPIRILVINEAKSVNGHLIRGFCSEPHEAACFIDELNDNVASETADGENAENRKRFGFCFDFGLACIFGQDVYEVMTFLENRIKAVVLRECDGIHDSSILPFIYGAGVFQNDWHGLIRGLREHGFNGDLIMDLGDTYKGFPPKIRAGVLKMGKNVADYLLWQISMEQTIRKYSKRVLFGAGNMCRAYMKAYGKDYPPLFTCDNNSSKWGQEFCGLTVENPEKLKELPEDVAIFLCNSYYDDTSEQLRNMGLKNPIEYFSDEYLSVYPQDRIKRSGV